MNPLEAYDIRKSYHTKEVLKGVSIEIHPGEIAAILGQNGAGKTTAIKIFSTLLKSDSGRLSLFGDDQFQNKNTNMVRRRIGYVGQDSERSAYARLTAEENLLFFGRLMGMTTRDIRQKMASLAKFFQFEDRMHEQFMKLSGGQKQTMIIMRALLHDPELIFLDEPTKGLDPVRARQIRLFLKKYVKEQGKSLLLTSHILTDIEFLADRVSFIKSGKIVFEGTPQNACELLGYTDSIEVIASARIDEIKAHLQRQTDIRIISENAEGHLVLGTNDFFNIIESIKNLANLRNSVEFSHHKIDLEDAYLNFTQTELEPKEGEPQHETIAK